MLVMPLRMPRIGDVGRTGGVADPPELAVIERHALGADRLSGHHVGHDHVRRCASRGAMPQASLRH